MITLRRIAVITVLVVLVLIAYSSVTGQGRNFNNATQIQGVNVSAVAPTNTQVLEYIAATKLWTPTTGGGGGGCTPGGTINYVLLDSGSGACNTSTTLSDSGTVLTYTGTGGIVSSGTVTAGGCMGCSGAVNFPQGTANGHAGTTQITEEAPASVTSYEHVLPGAAGTGYLLDTNVSGVVTETRVASPVSAATYYQVGGYVDVASTATSNTVSCVGIVVPPGGLSVGHINVYVGTADNSNNSDLGIYDSSGNLEAHIGAQHTSGTGQTTSYAFTGGTQTILTGKAFLCLTSVGSSYSINLSDHGESFYFFQSTGISSTGGALPGTITPPSDAPAVGVSGGPAVVLYP